MHLNVQPLAKSFGSQGSGKNACGCDGLYSSYCRNSVHACMCLYIYVDMKMYACMKRLVRTKLGHEMCLITALFPLVIRP